MNHDLDTAAPARQAALTVHALSEADRKWLLAALPPEDREELQLLLEELRALGIPQDRALATAMADAAVPKAKPGDWLRELEAGGAAAMASVLREQPVVFTRAVLALVPPPTARSVEGALGWATGGTLPAAHPLAPALERAVRTALEPHWRGALAREGAAKQAFGWRALKGRIAALGKARRA